MVMPRIDFHNMHDCIMSRQPTALRLWCRFPYNQMVKINASNGSGQTELSHVKAQMRGLDHGCSKTDCDAYLLASLFLIRSAECVMCFSLDIHCGWSGHKNKTLSNPRWVIFNHLFLHRVYRKRGEKKRNEQGIRNVPGIQSDEMQGFRWQPPSPPLSS